MKILFVLPYRNDGLEPLGMLYLAGAARRAGHEVEAVLPSKRALAGVFRTLEPDVLAYSVVTGWHRKYLELNRWVKATHAPHTLSIFGGPHPTYYPIMVQEEGVDAICLGEGEFALVDFLQRLENSDDHWVTSNWWVKQDGALHRNPLRPEIQNLDDLPFPDRSLLRGHPYYIKRHLRSFIASRGCAYDCSYCFNHAYRRLYHQDGLTVRVRHRSVNNLIAEIEQVRGEYDMRSVAFFDDIFVTSPAWLDQFAEAYHRRIGLPFECNLRVEQITHRSLARLKEAGCVIVAVGIEVADEQARADLLRRHYTNEEIAHACALVKEYGILLKTFNIVGLPPGHLQADLDTLAFNRVLKVDIPSASVFQPYPGTDLAERTRREGYWLGDVDSTPAGFDGRSSLRLADKAEIEVLQRLFFVSCRFRIFGPVLSVCLRLANIGLVHWTILVLDQTVSRLVSLIGRTFPIADDVRRRILRPRS